MAADLAAAVAFQIPVAAVLFVAARRLALRAPPRALFAVTCALFGGLVFFLGVGLDSMTLARVVPISSAIIAANPTLPLSALLGAVLSAQLPARRRILLPALLIAVGQVQTIRPLLGTPPPTRDSVCEKDVCPQTSDSSCSAASAATLLRAHHIAATETEMADLCLTRNAGTSMLGVYRGLRLKTAGTPWRVHLITGADAARLRQETARNGPVLLSVGLPRFPLKEIDPRYESAWGWARGQRHAVVLFGFLPDGQLDVGDPSVGREKWNVESLAVLSNGEGISLAR